MENNAGIIRTKAELERGLVELEQLKARAEAQGGGLTPV